MLFSSDVARVDADFVNPPFGCHQGKLIVKMDVSYKRHIRPIADGRKRLRRTDVRYGKTHNVTSGCLKGPDLFQGCFHIPGLGVAHALYRHRCLSADFQAANSDLSGLFPFLHLIHL